MLEERLVLVLRCKALAPRRLAVAADRWGRWRAPVGAGCLPQQSSASCDAGLQDKGHGLRRRRGEESRGFSAW